ncbi:MAG: hypothetical protein JWN86_186 [Planctomycetota bacterium]|nr:hypothetical protein [Planctomycetota bacterium]
MSHPHSGVRFPSTIWPQVANAGSPVTPEARDSLATLCEIYWQPIHALIRRHWHPADEALDLTQLFFIALLEKETLAQANRERGRFRDFLRKVCLNFLKDENRRRQATVHGGNISYVSVDSWDAEGLHRFEPVDLMTPDRLFERDWALTLLKRSLDKLAKEYAESNRARIFEEFKIVLTEGRGAVRRSVLAERLGMTENAVHQATSRLRVRYREILLEEITGTLDDPSQVDEEIRFLFDAVRA